MRKEDFSLIVVDDLQFSREVIKSALGKSGFNDIRTAASADEALYQLNQRRAHVVLADFWMPGMNGLEMADIIRRWDENNDRYTGIILLTAEDTGSSIVVAFDRGVDDFVSKSASQLELAARVYGAGRNACRQNQLRERMRSLGSQLLRIKQQSLQDPQTSLPNRTQLESRIEALLEHCKTRGGGFALGLIEVNSSNSELRLGTLKTIASSIRLSLRPMDMVSRFNINTFAVLVQYQDAEKFDTELFKRLINSIKQHTMQATDQGKQLSISAGVCLGHNFDPAPSVAEIIELAQKACAPI